MSRPINKSFLEHSQAHLFTFSVAAFVLQLQSGEAVAETGQPAKSLICTIWAFREK